MGDGTYYLVRLSLFLPFLYPNQLYFEKVVLCHDDAIVKEARIFIVRQLDQEIAVITDEL